MLTPLWVFDLLCFGFQVSEDLKFCEVAAVVTKVLLIFIILFFIMSEESDACEMVLWFFLAILLLFGISHMYELYGW
jgi:predicted membrane-bound dolichyl-phosphate-mannose-protein mannosyltransferase